MIISAFPGTGKTTLFNKLKNTTTIFDSDSSTFSKDETWPNNYLEYLKKCSKSDSIVLCSTHKEVRELLKHIDTKIYIAVPNINCKSEYLDRYRKRGSSEAFVNLLDKNWEFWIEDCMQDALNNGYNLIVLQNNEFLEIYLKQNKINLLSESEK